MGKLAVYRYVAMMFLIMQIVVSIFTILGLFGGNYSPVGNNAKAMIVYILPLLILANLLLLVYWLIKRNWLLTFVPIITLLCCIPYIGTLVQFRSDNTKAVAAQDGLTIATYNVAMFGRETSGFISQDILAEMKNQKVDVLCFQEYLDASGDKKVSDSYKNYFPYKAYGRDDMIIYSRYPIRKTDKILFEYSNNSAMWADIEVNGKIIRVYNVHLQTTGINGTLHQVAKANYHGIKVDKSSILRAIYGNYTLGLMIRSGQSMTIANNMRQTEHPRIICGDFNDVPYSYVYKTLLGNMVDGFKECGFGWMSTFRGGKKSVRIDYIFHDEMLKGLTYYKRELTYSDHYPVFMKIAL